MDYKKYCLVNNYEDYVIFSTGKVYSKKHKKFIKPHISNQGYLRIEISKNNNPKKYFVHRLIAEHFIENLYNLPSIDHIDRNKLNNDISNLRWSSRTLQNINKNIQKNNKTGTIGVYFHKIKNIYRAIWRVDGKKFSKSFSANKYSDEEAKQLAINYRAKMVEKHYKDII